MSRNHNKDGIEIFWEPHAVTDGDSIVDFRRADVIVAGDVFTTTQYPSSISRMAAAWMARSGR